jgi:hypothetical protein
MLCRSTTLQHPSGATLRTPLLVPSFSSKGFGFGKGGKSEVGQLFKVAGEYLTDSVLLSAYDLHYNHVGRPRSIITAITFVDSGGYETSDFRDLSAAFVHASNPRPWREELLRDVYNAWPDHIPAVFVAFDKPGPIRKQIDSAHKLLRRYPTQLHAILIKPGTKKSRRIAIGEIAAHASDLARFHMVGVTEKELGGSTLERMEAIARLRLSLDDADLRQIPIHVFGSLDPISVPLYFLAGAEVFDGLTWLRFGYESGLALYQYNCATRKFGIRYSDDQVKLLTLQSNLVELSELTSQMRRFLNDGDFDKFGVNSRLLRDAYELLRNGQPRAA